MPHADYYKSGDYNAECSMCGGKFKAGELRKHWQGMYRCARCWEPRQPQDFVKAPPPETPPPWIQPPNDVFAPSCSAQTRSAVPGSAGPGCAIPSYIFFGAQPVDLAEGTASVWWGNGPAPVPTNTSWPAPPDPTVSEAATLVVGIDGVGNGMLCRSIDGGISWSAETPTALNSGAIRGIAYSPTLDKLVCIFLPGNSGSAFEIYTSADRGISWTKNVVDHPFTNATPMLVIWSEIAERFIMTATRVSGSPAIIAYSDDGESWTLASPVCTTGTSGQQIFETSAEIVVLNGGNDEVYRSTDGETWSTDAFAPMSITTFSATGRVAYASTLGGYQGRAVLNRATNPIWSENSVISAWQYWEPGTGDALDNNPIVWAAGIATFVTGNGPNARRGYSVNAINWTRVNRTFLGTTRAIYWDAANSIIVEATSQGDVNTSSDGDTFTQRRTGAGSESFYDITAMPLPI